MLYSDPIVGDDLTLASGKRALQYSAIYVNGIQSGQKIILDNTLKKIEDGE